MYARVLLAILLCLPPASAIAADPLRHLAAFPGLHALYTRYPDYQTRLSTYAIQQGFLDPVEILATAIHELIHIDSAVHGGFHVNNTYINPYLAPSAWPYLTNRDLIDHLTPDDIHHLGPIHITYLRAIPNNKLSNTLDEINAYSQTVPFICAHAPTRANPHIHALAGHLTLVDLYLRIMADHFPAQYQRLASHRVSRGALETIVANAYQAVNKCRALGVPVADPRRIPKLATHQFARQPLPAK